MYAEMAKTIPNLSFIEGVPPNLHDETFIDSRFPHLIVFDDLMKDATKSQEVCELYTEGAHHRNLSVISLMQNLFNKGKENRTMNLNSHYLVIFKNPRDRQQVAVLGQQMYPHRSSYFMEKFNAATSQPYGCLVVDLKQETPEAHRLRSGWSTNQCRGLPTHAQTLLDQSVNKGEVLNQSTNEGETTHAQSWLNQLANQGETTHVEPEPRGLMQSWLNQSASRGETTPTLPTLAQTEPRGRYINERDALGAHSLPDRHDVHTSPQDTMENSCNECGALFSTRYMLNRHEEACPPEASSESSEDARSDSSEDKSEDESEDEGVWQGLVQRVYDGLDDEYQAKVERLETSGVENEEAKREAGDAMRSVYKRHLIKEYKKILRTAQGLKKSCIHKEIRDTIQWYMDKDYTFDDALDIAMKKTRHLFDGVLDEDSDAEDSDTEDSDAEDSDEDPGDENDENDDNERGAMRTSYG